MGKATKEQLSGHTEKIDPICANAFCFYEEYSVLFFCAEFNIELGPKQKKRQHSGNDIGYGLRCDDPGIAADAHSNQKDDQEYNSLTADGEYEGSYDLSG